MCNEFGKGVGVFTMAEDSENTGNRGSERAPETREATEATQSRQEFSNEATQDREGASSQNAQDRQNISDKSQEYAKQGVVGDLTLTDEAKTRSANPGNRAATDSSDVQGNKPAETLGKTIASDLNDANNGQKRETSGVSDKTVRQIEKEAAKAYDIGGQGAVDKLAKETTDEMKKNGANVDLEIKNKAQPGEKPRHEVDFKDRGWTSSVPIDVTRTRK